MTIPATLRQHLPASNKTVVIIGGGPSGMSCALWLKNAGLSPIIVDKADMLGGMQARSRASNTWLLGWQAATGQDVARQQAKHIAYERIQTFLGATVQSISQSDDASGWTVCVRTEQEDVILKAAYVVIAAGTEFSSEDWINSVPGSSDVASRIHVGPASFMDTSRWFGRHPVVIGGGDNALECAYTLAGRGSHPTLLVRGASFRAGQDSRDKLDACVKSGSLDVLMNASVYRIEADKANGGEFDLILNNGEKIKASSVFLMLGYNSNAPGVAKLLQCRDAASLLDASGYFIVDKNCETPYRDLFAIGDIANPDHPCVATAAAMGTMAARTIINRMKEEDAFSRALG